MASSPNRAGGPGWRVRRIKMTAVKGVFMIRRWMLRSAIGLAFTVLAANPANAIVVRRPPPAPPRGATMAIHRSPRHGMVWRPGYYRWRGGRYRWSSGRWVHPPRAGAIWVPPVWRHTPGGYAFVAGRWR